MAPSPCRTHSWSLVYLRSSGTDATSDPPLPYPAARRPCTVFLSLRPGPLPAPSTGFTRPEAGFAPNAARAARPRVVFCVGLPDTTGLRRGRCDGGVRRATPASVVASHVPDGCRLLLHAGVPAGD